jgi:hypothetical protein
MERWVFRDHHGQSGSRLNEQPFGSLNGPAVNTAKRRRHYAGEWAGSLSTPLGTLSFSNSWIATARFARLAMTNMPPTESTLPVKVTSLVMK